MGQFGTDTRRWLEGAIKQRKLLLKTNRSHKSQLEVEIAIGILDNQLCSYSYENDLYMARFIRQNIASIETILPGSGATGYEKRLNQLAEINKRAIMIIEGRQATGDRRQENTLKTSQYEMEFN
jgi:hypothetical protein